MDKFIVKHYSDEPHPTIKGNGFDGLVVGNYRDEAQDFIDKINETLEENQDLNKMLLEYIGMAASMFAIIDMVANAEDTLYVKNGTVLLEHLFEMAIKAGFKEELVEAYPNYF